MVLGQSVNYQHHSLLDYSSPFFNNLAIVRTVDREIIDFYYSEIIAKIILCPPPGELPKLCITKLLYM